MTLPADPTKADMDAAADDPKLARVELAALVDRFNELLTHMELSSILKDALTPGSGLQKNLAELEIHLQANPGLAVAAGGLIFSLTTLAAETAPAAADLVAIYDASAVAHRKATIPNLLKGGGLADLGNVTAPADGEFLKRSGSNYVGADPVAAASVDQAKLKTTNGSVSTTSVTTTNEVLPGGAFGFYPRAQESGGGAGNIASIVHQTPVVSSSLTTYVAISEGAAETFTVNQEYVQASPPYDLGDGEVPLFVFLVVASDGSVLTAYVAQDPPWANNGPTNIRPDFFDALGRGFQRRPKGFIDRVPVETLLASPALREQFLDAKRMIDPADPATFEAKQIDAAFKNSDMPRIPHHMAGMPGPLEGPDFVGATIVLLDPVAPLMDDLRIFSEEGDKPVAELIVDGLVEFGNSAIPGRKGPPGVMPVSVNWKP